MAKAKADKTIKVAMTFEFEHDILSDVVETVGSIIHCVVDDYCAMSDTIKATVSIPARTAGTKTIKYSESD